MKKLLTFAAASVAVLLTSVSCLKGGLENEYTGYTYANVTSPTQFTTDDGVVLTVSEDQTDTKWATERRVYIGYTIGNIVDKAAPIKLFFYAPVEIKHMLVKSTADQEEYGQDPVMLSSGVLTGTSDNRLFNIEAYYTCTKDTKVQHTVDLVFDDEKSKDNVIVAELVHNGHNDTYDNTEIDAKDIQVVSKYITIYLEEMLPQTDKDNYELSVSYKWYMSQGSGLVRTTETKTITGTIAK